MFVFLSHCANLCLYLISVISVFRLFTFKVILIVRAEVCHFICSVSQVVLCISPFLPPYGYLNIYKNSTLIYLGYFEYIALYSFLNDCSTYSNIYM